MVSSVSLPIFSSVSIFRRVLLWLLSFACTSPLTWALVCGASWLLLMIPRGVKTTRLTRIVGLVSGNCDRPRCSVSPFRVWERLRT